jgi:GNAT superfamily N-acetyltransferase
MLQRAISITPDLEFGGKSLWKTSSYEVGKELFDAIKLQCRQRDFSHSYLDFNSPTGGLFKEAEAHTSVLIGTRYRIEGYISFYSNGVNPNVGKVSRLEGLRCGGALHKDGDTVTEETLRNYPGYKDYSGKGEVCSINVVEAFYKHQGVGTLALKYLKEHCDFELIELEATGEQQWQIAFYEKQGFVDAQIDVDGGMRMAMVWNNPKYQR